MKEYCVRCNKKREMSEENPNLCEECHYDDVADREARKFMESLVGQEVEEGIIVSPQNMRDLFKKGYL